MNGKQLAVALAVAALGVFALFHFEVFGTSGTGYDEGDPGGGDGSIRTSGGDETAEGDASTTGGNPTLFGRGSRRTGVGDALGRVLSFESRKPVGDATLRLRGVGYGSETVALETTTGKDGRFHFGKVPAGDGFVLEVEGGELGDRTLRHLSISAEAVEDFGTIWLGESGVLEGRVVDTTEHGLANARVEVHPGAMTLESMMSNLPKLLAELDRDPEPEAKADTSSDGRFRIPGLPPGPATLIVRKEGYQVEVRQILMSKDGVVGAKPVITLEDSQPISGRVVSQSGEGIPGARIAFMDAADQESGFYARQFSETDADGNFVVESPPNTARLVAIVAAERYPTMIRNLREGQRKNLLFVLVGGAEVTIRLLKSTGEPIDGASIMAFNTDKPGMGSLNNAGTILSGTTDARGEIEVLARPGYMPMMMVTHPTEGGAIYMPAMPGAQMLGQALLKGPKDSKINMGRNVLEFTKPEGYVFTGVVKDLDGVPIVGAKVGLTGQMAIFSGGSVASDSDGNYRLFVPKLPAMMLAISARATGFVMPTNPAQPDVSGGGPEIVHDIVLERAARITGTVLAPDGKPLGGAQVRLSQKGEQGGSFMNPFANENRAMTSRDGTYHFETVNKKESYVVVARADGYIDTATAEFRVAADAQTVRAPKLTIQRGLDLVIHVMEPDGRLLEGARVDVNVERKDKAEWDMLSRWVSFAKVLTNDKGEANVRAVPDGRVTLTARAKGFAGARLAVDVTRDAPPKKPIEIRLNHAITLSGKVIDPDGKPVRAANVSVVVRPENVAVPGADQPAGEAGAGWQDRVTAETDRRGAFLLRDVSPANRISLAIECEGYQMRTIDTAGRTEGIEITLRPIDKDRQKRIQELEADLMGLYGELTAAKDDEARQQLAVRVASLQAELTKLRAEQPPEPPIEPGAEPGAAPVPEDLPEDDEDK